MIRAKGKCKKCGDEHYELWPLGGGICDRCLVKNYTLKKALTGVCSCLYKKVAELYKVEKSTSRRKKPNNKEK